jgi:hypothetical protein
MHDPKDGHRSVSKKNCCLNTEVEKYLVWFNLILRDQFDEPGVVDRKRYQKMIHHLLKCRFCRRRLSKSGKMILDSEIFWGGYFLKGEARARRRKLRALLHQGIASHDYTILNQVVETARQAEIIEECKRIERFLKD